MWPEGSLLGWGEDGNAGILTSSRAHLNNILCRIRKFRQTILWKYPPQKSIIHCLKLTEFTVYTILWRESTLLLKHFRNNLLNIYSIGLNRAEPTVAEPVLITAEDSHKPRTVQI